MIENLPDTRKYNGFGDDQEEIDYMEIEDCNEDFGNYCERDDEDEDDMEEQIEGEIDWQYLHSMHIECGGCLTLEDFQLAYTMLRDSQFCDIKYEEINSGCKRASKIQIYFTLQRCDIPIREEEIKIYSVLRSISSNGYHTQIPNTTPVCQLGDNKLIEQVVLITDESECKADILREKYPCISESEDIS